MGRRCPLDIVQGLETILSDYAELNMWEEETDDNSRTSRAKDVAQLEILAVRRSVFLALVFNHLCYFHPKMVTLEDSPQGLSLRLGLALDLLEGIREVLSQPPLAAYRVVRNLQRHSSHK